MENMEIEEIKIDELEALGEVVEGTITGIKDPVKVETRFGTSYRIPFTVKLNDAEIEVSILVRENSLKRKVLHPRSNLYKLMQKYGVRKVKDLVGKKVQLRVDARGFYRFLL